MDLQRLHKMAEAELARILNQLPPEIRNAAGECPVQLMERPDENQCGGDDPDDLLGLFEGASRLEPVPCEPDHMPRISLFLGALYEEAGEDEGDFRNEVKITYLHELGHYLGWDEEQVEALGL